MTTAECRLIKVHRSKTVERINSADIDLDSVTSLVFL